MGLQATPSSDPPLAERSFTSGEVASIAQVSLRQLQWWDERKILSLGREAYKRTYLPHDVIEVLVIAELRRKGISLRVVRQILRFLRRELDWPPESVLDMGADLYLVTDGRAMYLEDDHEAVVDRLKTARRPMLLVCISDQAKRLEQSQKVSRARKRARQKRSPSVEGQLTLFS